MQQSDSVRPFDAYHLGRVAFDRPEVLGDMAEGIRLYMEESDNPQGFQVLADTQSGFSGVADGMLDHLNDEYGGKTIVLFALTPPVSELTERAADRRVINAALSAVGATVGFPFPRKILTPGALPAPTTHTQSRDATADGTAKTCPATSNRRSHLYIARPLSFVLQSLLSTKVSLHVPLSVGTSWTGLEDARAFAYRDYHPTSLFQTSAILATAIDSATLPLRLCEDRTSLNSLAAALTQQSVITPATQTLPIPIGDSAAARGDTFMDLVDGEELLVDRAGVTALTPGFSMSVPTVSSVYTIRGISASLLRPRVEVLQQRRSLSVISR